MTGSQQQGVGPATMARLIHAALLGGCVLFGLVNHFVIRPQRSDSLPPAVLYAILAASVAAIAACFLFLRGRVPLKSSNESADLFWTRASAPALIAWCAVEGAALLALVAYMLDGSVVAIAVAGVAVLALILQHPATFERR